jgi:hypothetical protein
LKYRNQSASTTVTSSPSDTTASPDQQQPTSPSKASGPAQQKMPAAPSSQIPPPSAEGRAADQRAATTASSSMPSPSSTKDESTSTTLTPSASSSSPKSATSTNNFCPSSKLTKINSILLAKTQKNASNIFPKIPNQLIQYLSILFPEDPPKQQQAQKCGRPISVSPTSPPRKLSNYGQQQKPENEQESTQNNGPRKNLIQVPTNFLIFLKLKFKKLIEIDRIDELTNLRGLRIRTPEQSAQEALTAAHRLSHVNFLNLFFEIYKILAYPSNFLSAPQIGDEIVEQLVEWTKMLPFYSELPVEVHTHLLTHRWAELVGAD